MLYLQLDMRLLLLCICVSWASALSGQNELDEKGRKTGHWRVEYPGGSTLYEGDFVKGEPVGTMLRYYESGALRSKMEFDTAAGRAYTILYYPGGKKAAEGWYEDKQKDSVWTYYSRYDGSVKIREPYDHGQMDGVVRKYYSGGSISEEVSWESGKRDGPWKQYYPDGAPRLVGRYDDGTLQGPYKVFYADTTLKAEGTYIDGRSHGIWKYYSQEGELLYTIEFRHGKAVNRERYLEMMEDSLRRFGEAMELPREGQDEGLKPGQFKPQ